MLLKISQRYDYFLILVCYNEIFITMQILVSFGLVFMELCSHKINMNTEEKILLRRSLKCDPICLTYTLEKS